MAELQQVVINEATESEGPTLEEQAAQMEADGKLPNTSEQPQQEEVPQEEVQDERPDWLPEKFNSVEDMAKAYGELEKKQSSSEEPTDEHIEEAPEEEAKATKGASKAVNNASEEFAETGELSPKTYKALEKAGISQEYVDMYIAGQQAVMNAQANEIQSLVGGERTYEEMSSWAAENLTDNELDAYNSVVESGSMEQSKMAVRGLFARYKEVANPEPTLHQGDTTGSSVKPFTSAAQVSAAMRDKRYNLDPSYRKEVEGRLAVSNVL